MKELKNNPMFLYLILLTATATAGLQAWRTIFNNFAVEVANLNVAQVGAIQSIREIPGFLTFLVIFLIVFIKEHKLSAVSIIIMSLGIIFTGFFPSFIGLIITTLLMSLGFHYYETTNQSLTLQYFSKEHSPYVLAKQKSISAIVSIIVGVFIWITAKFISMKLQLIVFGLFILGVGIWASFKNPAREDLPHQHKKMILRKKYWLFYLLNFLSGARRQIFVVFAVFLLVKKYQFSIQEITILFVLNNVINYFFAPFIAKFINKYGERKVLSSEYFFLIFVFLGYAFIESKIWIAALYVVDHIFFNFSIAIKTYFHKTADKKDIAPSMAVGYTINHISAVVIPLTGGLLSLLDWRIPFIAGAGLSVLSLMIVQKIKIEN